eukprot:13616361-Ditylum_brightwellii.AAC.1
MQEIVTSKLVDMAEVYPVYKKPTFTTIPRSLKSGASRIPPQDKSEAIVVHDNTGKQKKSSSQHTRSEKVKANIKGKQLGKDKKKICVLCQQFGGNPNYHTAKDCYRHKVITPSKTQTPYKHPTGGHMSMEDLYTSNLKLTKKLKKYKKQKGKHRIAYKLESLDSDSDAS